MYEQEPKIDSDLKEGRQKLGWELSEALRKIEQIPKISKTMELEHKINELEANIRTAKDAVDHM